MCIYITPKLRSSDSRLNDSHMLARKGNTLSTDFQGSAPSKRGG